MQVIVETEQSASGASGEREPVAFAIGARRFEVRTVLDRWVGRDHAYFKLVADDGALYILRRSAEPVAWELHWFNAGGAA